MSAQAAVRKNSASLHQIARYQGRLSGPFLDRLDLQIEVPVIPPALLATAPDGEASKIVAGRVAAARERAVARQGCSNALLSVAALDTHARVDKAALALLHNAAERLGWSARSYHRVIRVARTIADLAASQAIRSEHMAEAVQLRRGLASG